MLPPNVYMFELGFMWIWLRRGSSQYVHFRRYQDVVYKSLLGALAERNSEERIA